MHASAATARHAPPHHRGRRACLLASLALLSTTLACGGSRTPDPAGALTVRLAYLPNLTNAVGLVATANGSLRQALAPHTLEVTPFSAGPALIEALLAGAIDIAYVGPSPAVNGYVKSRGALRAIAGASSGGALFVARPDARIASPADLAGKRIATPQRGGTQDVALRFMARSAGLQTADEGGSVTIVPMAPADILTAFQRGQIDGAWMAEPWPTRLVQEAGAQVWFDERSHWPDGRFATTHVIVAARFLEQHPDVVKAFLRAHVDTARLITERPAETSAIANGEIRRVTTAALPPAVLETSFRHIDFTYDPLIASVDVMADRAFQLGFLGTSKPDLSGYYALEPLNAVLAEKGLPAVATGGGTR